MRLVGSAQERHLSPRPVPPHQSAARPKKAIVAVAASILTAIYHMLKDGTRYQDLGPDYFDKRNSLRATRRLIKRLEALGHRVILEPRFTANPSQAGAG